MVSSQSQFFVSLGPCNPGGFNHPSEIAYSDVFEKYLAISYHSSSSSRGIYCIYYDGNLNPIVKKHLSGFPYGSIQISSDTLKQVSTGISNVSATSDTSGNFTMAMRVDSTLRITSGSNTTYIYNHFILTICVDSIGDIKWKHFVPVNSNYPFKIIFNRYCNSYFLSSGNSIFRIDTQGNFLWKLELNTNYPLSIKDIAISNNQNLLVLGNDSTNIFFSQIDTSGDVAGYKFFDSGSLDVANSFDIYPNGKAVVNSKHPSGFGDLILFDQLGNIILSKSIPDSILGSLTNFHVYSDSELVVHASGYFYKFDSLLNCQTRNKVYYSSSSSTSSQSIVVTKFLKIDTGVVLLKEYNYSFFQLGLYFYNTELATATSTGDRCTLSTSSFFYSFNDVAYSEVSQSISSILTNAPPYYQNDSIIPDTNNISICGPNSCVYNDVLEYNRNNNNHFNIYPNPSSGIFIIKVLHPSISDNAQLEIYNTLGQKILAESITKLSTNIELRSDPGIYLVRLVEGENTFTQKLILH
jgi:hypothetical protein